MLNQEALEKLSERLVIRAESLNTYMLKKMAKQIYDIGTLTPSQLREILQSVQYGNDIDEIITAIANMTDKNIKDIYEIFEEVAKTNQEFAKQFYDYSNTKYIPFNKNISLQKQVKAIADITAKEYTNMAKTMAFTRINANGVKEFTDVSDIYQQVTDEAIMSIAQGRESYETVKKRLMNELTSNGIRTVDYDTGYSRRLDSSVRMNIMDGIRRLNMDIQDTFGKEYGANGVEVSHHINSAPDHIDTVDGQQFSNEDFEIINNALDRHVGELNCYHFTYPIILGVSKPMYSKEELEADKEANNKGFELDGEHYTNYEGTQMQRQLEAKIRQYKDKQIFAKQIGDTDEVFKCDSKITQLTYKYNELCKTSGLPTKVERLRVENYKKSNIKLSKYDDVTQNWLDSATPNSNKVLDKKYFIDDKGTKYNVDGKNVVLDYSKYEKETAEWLENTLGGELYMVPRINNPKGVPSADYLFRNEYFDLKQITGNGKKTIDSAIKKKKNQAHNFIIDISNSNMLEDEALRQSKRIFDSKDRQWIDTILLKNNNNLVKIYKKKRLTISPKTDQD